MCFNIFCTVLWSINMGVIWGNYSFPKLTIYPSPLLTIFLFTLYTYIYSRLIFPFLIFQTSNFIPTMDSVTCVTSNTTHNPTDIIDHLLSKFKVLNITLYLNLLSSFIQHFVYGFLPIIYNLNIYIFHSNAYPCLNKYIDCLI